jgi:methylmalonyl-CoA/ethylmalonyl-CoA epimerase
VFGDLDHVGLIVRDLEASVARARASFGLPVARTATLERWGVEAVYLGEGTGSLELFTLADPALSEGRLAGADERLDHVCFRVADLAALAGTLRAAGVRFTGPDRQGEIDEPIDLGGTMHYWTLPDSSGGLALQLSQRAR